LIYEALPGLTWLDRTGLAKGIPGTGDAKELLPGAREIPREAGARSDGSLSHMSVAIIEEIYYFIIMQSTIK